MSTALADKDQEYNGLRAYLTPYGAWSYALGTSIGWGSLIITGTTYLAQAGPMGSVLGMLAGLAVMLVIARNYHYMMSLHPDAGGVYGYARDVFGYDHGVLVAWFLALTYAAMLWANATSLPLFARYFIGSVFQVGFHYQLFGYDVYLGEALLSAAVVLLAGAFCARRKRGAQAVMIALVAIFALGITVCFVGAMLGRDAGQFSFKPTFVPGTPPLMQVLRIACLSSWAFIGFESISHASEEFAFDRSKSYKVLVISLVTTTALYVFVTLLSITAYPPQYGDWLAYINDMGNVGGIEHIPAFYAARQYLGGVGVALLMVSLLALIVTSLIGNIMALSRLLYALARDRVIPAELAQLNANGIPSRAIYLIAALSSFVPLVGRTAIGWIVDVTTLGATVVYSFMSVCAYVEGRRRKDAVQRATGLVGTTLMVLAGVYLLLPSLVSAGTMATESYFLFAAWGIAGFVFFRHLLLTDEDRRFGKSIISWVALLSLILFASLAWMSQSARDATNEAIESVRAYFGDGSSTVMLSVSDGAFMEQAMVRMNASISRRITMMTGLFTFSLAVMLSNFSIVQKREAQAHAMATRDALTGVKSKFAYAQRESDLNEQLSKGELDELAIVVCDVNGLKQVNDTLGHKAGDEYIRSASMMICRLFKHSPVFRIGGDEFVVLLTGQDFQNRNQILAALDAQSVANRAEGKVVVAAGMAQLMPDQDKKIQDIFERADAAMYQRKVELKGGADVR